MKVIVLNSSPAMHEGNTALILEPFLQGMRESGAEVELFYVRKLKINPCLGCLNCWLSKPGQCCQRDDMDILYPKLASAQILVLATPLYVDGMTGTMKILLDRLVPGAEPFIELRDGHCRHPSRGGSAVARVALVSNCGFWEMDNFDSLVAHVKAICKNLGADFAGALLRPHGGAMKPLQEHGVALDDIFSAAHEAGKQVVRTGSITPDTMRIVSRELMPLKKYLELANQFFHEQLDSRS
ncbi:MAG: flavodoxin family protein [Candidatus Aureabacteria bacterium]|nr:flavodoxin family protein [Candidatus Auribacterota bacterium]